MVYDCIVLGVGGIGSAALYAAAKRGWSVLGIERFGAVHDRGSSHGRTRIIRTAYFEHPDYVPLVRSAWQRWESIQSQDSTPLLYKTGLLQAGEESGEVIKGVLASARQHDIEIQEMSAAEAMKQFPALKLPVDSHVVFEQQAGILLVENCVAQMIRLAQLEGAKLMTDTLAEKIKVNANQTITVTTDRGRYDATRLIMTPGSWSGDLLTGLQQNIRVLRKPQFWFQIDRTDIKLHNGFPAFLIERPEDCFYCIPELDYLGMKVAEHSGGVTVEDPSCVDRACDPGELAAAEAFLDRHFNFTRRRLVHHSVCMYSMSTDGHFVVDAHPDFPNIVFAAGMSGHGFKFAPVIGERLVGMLESEPYDEFEFLRQGSRKLV